MNTKQEQVLDTKSLVKMAKARGDVMGCADLFQYVPISQPSMSQHLKVLAEAGLLESRKEGRQMLLVLNHAKLQELESFLHLLNVSKEA